MGYLIEIGAIIGGSIGVLAFLPQIRHLVKVKNSTGVSLAAWYIWLLSESVLVLYAIYIKSIVFIVVDGLYAILCLWIIILTYKYKVK